MIGTRGTRQAIGVQDSYKGYDSHMGYETVARGMRQLHGVQDSYKGYETAIRVMRQL